MYNIVVLSIAPVRSRGGYKVNIYPSRTRRTNLSEGHIHIRIERIDHAERNKCAE
jgi:hypothetical protein